jgi:hypothetical protein
LRSWSGLQPIGSTSAAFSGCSRAAPPLGARSSCRYELADDRSRRAWKAGVSGRAIAAAGLTIPWKTPRHSLEGAKEIVPGTILTGVRLWRRCAAPGLGAIDPHAMHDDGKLAGDRDQDLLHTHTLG